MRLNRSLQPGKNCHRFEEQSSNVSHNQSLVTGPFPIQSLPILGLLALWFKGAHIGCFSNHRSRDN